MINVFVRSWRPTDLERWPLRHQMAALVMERWSMVPQDTVQIHWSKGSGPQFHMAAKRFAEEHATSDVYVVADDDCLILGRDFVERGVATLRAWPDYGLLAAVSAIDDAATNFGGAIVWERHAVGGVAFVRRGILKRFDACPANLTDETICNEVTQAGYKVGVMPGVRFNHLGYGYGADGPYWEA